MAEPALLQPIREAIRADIAFARDALLELIRTPSTGPSESAAQDRFATFARSSGLDVEVVPIPEDALSASDGYVETGLTYGDRPNVIATLRGEGAGAFLINSHIDTVHLTTGWSHDPMGEMVGDRVFGLGSADAKGCLVAALVAARALVNLGIRPPGDMIIQSVIDEEGSGNGTLAALLAAPPGPCRLAVVLEPTDLDVAFGHRGMLAIDVACPGRSAHGATGGGVNAISSAARTVLALERLGTELATHVSPKYAPPSLNIGLIAGGHEVYTTPDACNVRFSVRYAPSQRDELLELVRVAIDALEGESEPGYAPRVADIRDFGASETSLDTGYPRGFADVARLVRPSTQFTTLAGTCDARHIRGMLGTGTLIFGPGRLQDAHGPDEHVELTDVLEAATVLAMFAATP